MLCRNCLRKKKTKKRLSLQWNDSFLLSRRVKYKGIVFKHLPTVHSSLHDNTPISERTYSFFYRWVQNISDAAATEFLSQRLNDPTFVVTGWCISAALWAAGKQHEKSLKASSASGLQALQPQQEVPKAAPHQLTAWKVSTTDSLSPNCCDDKYSYTEFQNGIKPPITVSREETLRIVFIIIITCVRDRPTFQTPRASNRNVCQHASEWKGAL